MVVRAIVMFLGGGSWGFVFSGRSKGKYDESPLLKTPREIGAENFSEPTVSI
jgi:hypothetical protein